jgi:hypothetical protein
MTDRATSDIGPFAIVPDWILRSAISDRALRLFALLARHANRESNEAFPLRSTLASALKVSVDSVDRACRELVTIGAVHVEARHDAAGDRTSNIYRLTFAAPQLIDGVAAPLRPPSRTPAATVAAPVRQRTIPSGTIHTQGALTGSGVMAGTLPRDHRRHAWCGRKCVPDFLHGEFLRSIGGDEAKARKTLEAFYERAIADIPDDQPIADEPLRFWRAKFAAAFGQSQSTGSRHRSRTTGRTGAPPPGTYDGVMES